LRGIGISVLIHSDAALAHKIVGDSADVDLSPVQVFTDAWVGEKHVSHRHVAAYASCSVLQRENALIHRTESG